MTILFEIQFETWENDCDFYKTKTLYFSKTEDVNFYKELALNFTSVNNKPSGMGNKEYGELAFDELILELMENHPNISISLKEDWLKEIGNEYGIYEKLCSEILSEPEEYDYGFCRVMSRVKVNKIELGQWISTITRQKVVLTSVENNIIYYRYSEHPKDENGEIDISKLVWKDETCSTSEIKVQGDVDEISKKVLKIR